MALDIVLLVVGLALLVWSADQFVLGSSRLAALASLPPIVIGAVVMGFGTSAPEMLVSALAARGGDRDLGIGNIVGSNVANLSLVLGTAAFVATMTISRSVLRREAPLALGSAILLSILVFDGEISRWHGFVLLGVLIVIITTLVRSGSSDLEADLDLDDVSSETTMGFEIGRTLVGLVGTLGAAQMVVWAATDIADAFDVSGGFVGFTLVALGTSLPELVTTVACARRNETELIVGNLFGSNIFNSLAVGGAMAFVGPGSIDDPALTDWGIGIMLGVSVLAYVLAALGRDLTRANGVVLVAAYAASTAGLALIAGDDAALESGGVPADGQVLAAPEER